ncbi:hypothetical protein ACI7RC_15770 [Brevibacillus sp. B_LB10_24]|uniref:hypothetical protein n=1 Tax=Brevibacillus sp. B_LB10_24 TaxID=3380645 RepID=UPI0038B95A0B
MPQRSELRERDEQNKHIQRQWSEERDIHSEQQRLTEDTHRQPFYRKKKHQFWMGITALLMVLFTMFENTGSGRLKDVQSGIGKGMRAGVTLAAADDDIDMQPRDFNIEMKKGLTTSRLLIWDFAAEDGDVVTIKVNGSVLADNLGIFHEPAVLDIPIPSIVEIVGVKDGVGGITYGVKFPGGVVNNAYFNAAPVGSANVYTITGQ